MSWHLLRCPLCALLKYYVVVLSATIGFLVPSVLPFSHGAKQYCKNPNRYNHPVTWLSAIRFVQRYRHRCPVPLPSGSRSQYPRAPPLHPVTKYCFDDPRLTGLWNHGRGILAGIGLADRIPMIQTINGWPGNKSHPFQGMKRKRFCPNLLY